MEINKNICQICQLKSVQVGSEITNDEDSASILSELFGNEIVNEIHLNSSAICSNCWNTINQFHELYQKVQIQFQNYKNFIVNQHFIKEEPFTTPSSDCKIENLSSHNENIDYEEADCIGGDDDSDNSDDYEHSGGNVTPIQSSSSSTPPKPPRIKKKLNPPIKNGKEKSIKCASSSTAPKPPRTKTKLSPEIKNNKEKSFKCEQCGNSFYAKKSLTRHIQIVHDLSDTQVCDICAKIFKSKSSLNVHLLKHINKNVEQPKVQCKVCESWLKNELGLKKHMIRHNDGLQVCSICKKEAPNKFALNNHMQYVHSERKHKCSVCDKGFTQPLKLREHMASHTGQALYTCTYCPQTFKSNGNMHKHRKKAHTIEWMNNHRQKK